MVSVSVRVGLVKAIITLVAWMDVLMDTAGGRNGSSGDGINDKSGDDITEGGNVGDKG